MSEAEHLEHAASDDSWIAWWPRSMSPTVDPHGAPIPTRDGTVHEAVDTHRSPISRPASARRVVCVSDDDPARLRYLAELGLVPGAVVVLVDPRSLRRPGQHSRRRRRPRATEYAIGPTLGRGVMVEPTDASRPRK